MRFAELLEHPPKVLNIGVREFAEALRLQEAVVVEMSWSPPPTIEPEIEQILGKLI